MGRVSPCSCTVQPVCTLGAMWTSQWIYNPVRFHKAQYIIPCAFTTGCTCDAIPGEFIEIMIHEPAEKAYPVIVVYHRDFMRFVNSYRCVISHFLSFHRDFLTSHHPTI